MHCRAAYGVDDAGGADKKSDEKCNGVPEYHRKLKGKDNYKQERSAHVLHRKTEWVFQAVRDAVFVADYKRENIQQGEW